MGSDDWLVCGMGDSGAGGKNGGAGGENGREGGETAGCTGHVWIMLSISLSGDNELTGGRPPDFSQLFSFGGLII